MKFRTFDKTDDNAVCEFLIALNRENRDHIHWNWARFEWMFGHPEFDLEACASIGLWEDGGRIVGAAIYDMYFGEAFCAALPGYDELYPEILDYAYRALRDGDGLAISLCDGNRSEIEAARKAGFAPIEQTETVLRRELEEIPAAPLPAGLQFAQLDQTADADALSWLFWQGFDHGQDRAEFERTEQIPARPRRHFERELCVAAATAEGEPVSCCGLWHRKGTDYAYVEPVCTIPAYRGKGVARAIIFEALRRARSRGARYAYVISDMDFYRKLGFETDHHFTFYKKA